MLKTPDSFVPLLSAQDHAAPNCFVFSGDEMLVRVPDLALPEQSALAGLGLVASSFQPVGLLHGVYSQATWLPVRANAPPGHEWRKLRSLFGGMDDGLLAVAGRAYQLAEWARTHRYCGACGSATAHVAGERCVRCPACGFSAYPRISPAMMVLVRKGDAILLARHKASSARFFTALAGFVEAGESIEETVHREVLGEVGLKVRDLRYFGSQPWPFPHSLMIAYTAEYESGEIRVDENEIAEARWFGPGEPIPLVPPGISIASHLIHAHLPPGCA